MISTPCDKNAIPEVHRVLEYLNSIEGKAVITGQHTQSMGMEEVENILQETGKLPALCGFELLAYSPNINWADADEACLLEVKEDMGTLRKAYEWAEKKGLITLTWHWFSPLGGIDKSFYTENTNFDAEKALCEGSLEYMAMCHDLDIMAELLRGFQEKHVPILWRPFHECDGGWFWWGAKGVNTARELYRFMFHYFTEKHQLHNLIWVWNSMSIEGYVGDEYCDIISRDMYPPAHEHSDFADKWKELCELTEAKKGTAIGEIGVLPDLDKVQQSRTPWLWYMTWSHDFCLTERFNTKEALKKLYNHPIAVTLDKMPQLY
ncbi:MAG: beta-mannosidase [Lachnospiraceae bacterium]|nr:beta-mannosidase [Lachnospiraceae bacterium]